MGERVLTATRLAPDVRAEAERDATASGYQTMTDYLEALVLERLGRRQARRPGDLAQEELPMTG